MRHFRVNVTDIVEVIKDQLLCVYGPVENRFIDNLSDIEHLNELSLDWVNPLKINKQEVAEKSIAKVIIVGSGICYSDIIRGEKKTLLVVKNPKVALARVGNTFFVGKTTPLIHPTAIIDSDAIIGDGVYIGPYSVIGKVTIGSNSYISSNVRIYDDVRVGDNCFVKEGAVIGGAGFGYEIDEEGNHFRFPQIGGVILGNHVEIGANTCIDRGALSDTVIGDYTKIDNLVHIAHNVKIGNNCMIIACSEISGSCIIDDNVWIGPNSSVREWKHIGKDVLVGLSGVVVKDIPEGEVWAGNPARKLK